MNTILIAIVTILIWQLIASVMVFYLEMFKRTSADGIIEFFALGIWQFLWNNVIDKILTKIFKK